MTSSGKYYTNSPGRSAMKTTRDVPVPTGKARGTNKGYTDAIKLLEVGESIWLPTSSASVYCLAGAVRLAQDYQARQYVVRREVAPAESTADGELPAEVGARIWRTV
jgi:hypothetical protein